MELYRRISDIHLDVLSEIGNIGAGNAATSMSLLTGQKVLLGVPDVKLIPFDEVMELIGGPDELVAAIYLRFLGDTSGTVLFILPVTEAEHLVKQMLTDTAETFRLQGPGEEDHIGYSALKEAGNIMAGSYLSALSDFLNINMQPTIPDLSIDMAGAVLSEGLLELSYMTDFALIIDAKMIFEENGCTFNGHFLFFPDANTLPKVFSALGIDDDA